MRQIVLLRGINIGSRNRVSMPQLRTVLEEAGYDDVQTYVQSGNVVLSSRKSAASVGREVERLIESELGLEIDVVTRTRDELARIVRRNPLGDVATDPKRYQVSFLSKKLDAAVVKTLRGLATDDERLAVSGREVYAWHPGGAARSKLWAALAGKGLGVAATSRNWTTVTKLLELADS